MTTAAPVQRHRINATSVGAAALGMLAMLAVSDATHPHTTQTVPVRLTALALPPLASGPFGGFAADNDDDQAQQQAQLQQQLALQQMQQSQQLAEEQNEAAEQQATDP